MKIKTILFLVCVGVILFFTIRFFLEKREMQNIPASLLAVEDIIQGTFLLWDTEILLVDGVGKFTKDDQIMQVSFYTPTDLVPLSETMAVAVLSLTNNSDLKEFYVVLFSLQEELIIAIDSVILPGAMDVAHVFVDYDVSSDTNSLLYVSTFIEEDEIMIPVTHQMYVSSEGFTFVPQSDGSLSEEIAI
ncbi:MAG: hypothetical protein K9M36_03505 [Candidatus Pacebacteria bacterium]|nr:hypothetical protein [Candidatus Paceibacterota bacterium]